MLLVGTWGDTFSSSVKTLVQCSLGLLGGTGAHLFW